MCRSWRRSSHARLYQKMPYTTTKKHILVEYFSFQHLMIPGELYTSQAEVTRDSQGGGGGGWVGDTGGRDEALPTMSGIERFDFFRMRLGFPPVHPEACGQCSSVYSVWQGTCSKSLLLLS